MRKKQMSSETTGALAPIQTRAAVTIGTRGLQPADLDGLWRTAQYVAKSGLAPKGVETPEAVFVAMEMGLELGLPILASLQNIAVVNGRPTLWGDSQLAVVRSTGELEEFSEWYEVGGKRVARNPAEFTDTTTAVCRVKRRGMEASETAFSVADAKRAGLWGKSGPWTQYPARMLRFRARSFGLRDQFGDALRGLLSTEEAQDIPMVNVTPTAATTFRKPDATAKVPDPVEVMETASAPEPAPVVAAEAPAQSDADKLGIYLAENSVSFDGFQRWAVANNYGGADTWTTYADIPDEIAVRLLKAKKGVLAQILIAQSQS